MDCYTWLHIVWGHMIRILVSVWYHYDTLLLIWVCSHSASWHICTLVSFINLTYGDLPVYSDRIIVYKMKTHSTCHTFNDILLLVQPDTRGTQLTPPCSILMIYCSCISPVLCECVDQPSIYNIDRIDRCPHTANSSSVSHSMLPFFASGDWGFRDYFSLVARYIVQAWTKHSYTMSSAHTNGSKIATVDWLTLGLLGSVHVLMFYLLTPLTCL